MPDKIRERPNVLDPDHDGASFEPITSNRLRIACGSYVNQLVAVYPITAKTTEFIGVPQKLCNAHAHLPSFDAFSSAIPRAGLRAVLFNIAQLPFGWELYADLLASIQFAPNWASCYF
jgi:hypothetical protein